MPRATWPATSPARCRSAMAATAASIPTPGCRRRRAARSIPLHPLCDGRGRAGGAATRTGCPRTRPARADRVIIGSGIGGLQSIAEDRSILKEKGPRRISPFFIPGALINLCSGQVSIRYGFKGAEPCRGDRLLDWRACDRRRGPADQAWRCRRHGRGRRGGGDLRIGIAGFAACKALSTGSTTSRSGRAGPMTRTATGS